MRPPRGFGGRADQLEIIDAIDRLRRRAQRLGDAMRRCVEPPRQAPGVGGGIVEDADQRLVTVGQRPAGAEAHRFEIFRAPAVFA